MNLYYCYSCGMRLTPEEAEAAVTRGESFATACCGKCAQQGRRIKDPQAAEQQALETAGTGPVVDTSKNPIPNDSAEIASLAAPVAGIPRATPGGGVRVLSASTARAKRPGAPETRKSARPERPQHVFPALVVFGGGMVVVIAGILIFSLGRNGKDAPPPHDSAVKSFDTPTVVPPPPSAVAQTENSPPESARTKSLPAPAAATAKDDAPLEAVENYLRLGNFNKAIERLEAFEKTLSPDKLAEQKAKSDTLRQECVKGSKAALDEIIRQAEARAASADLNGVRMLFLPYKLEYLLPEDVQAADKESTRLGEIAQGNVAAVEEKKRADAAAALAAFENNLPAADSLPPPPGTVIFGPRNDKTRYSEALTSLRSPAGKVPYYDGTTKLVLDAKGSVLGTTATSTAIIEYSAAQDCDVLIKVRAEQHNWIGGTVKFSAGQMQKKEVPIDKGLWNKGGREGRTYNGFSLEIKNMKPGGIAVFRITLK